MWSYILVIYENLPAFCLVCNNIGHVTVDCRSLNRNKKISKKEVDLLVKQVYKAKTLGKSILFYYKALVC